MDFSQVPLPRSFYATDACTLAKSCLGKRLVLETPEGTLSGIITETEAYRGIIDRASHAYGGRRTKRNEIMYHPAGFAYVYRIYGIYCCLNVTATVEDDPEAVLFRSVVPVQGMMQMAVNRQAKGRAKSYPTPETMTEKQRSAMTKGPGRLCTAFGIDLTWNGWDMTKPGGLYLTDTDVQIADVQELPRVGIDYAGEDRDKPWRYLAHLL